MKTIAIIASLLFATSAFAADKVLDGNGRCVNCPPPKKVFHEPFKCKPGLEKVECKGKHRCVKPKAKVVEAPVVVPAPPCPKPAEPATKTVIVTKEVLKTVTVQKVVEVERASPWEIMAFGRFGAHYNTGGYPSTQPGQEQLNGKFNNWGTWDVGTEFHLKPVHLGLRTSIGNNGIAGLLQVFPIQGRLNWYLGAGGAFTAYPFYRPTVPQVGRSFDVQVATGVEYAFTPHLIGLADLRASVPVPWTNAPGLTWDHVGSALTETAVLVGLGYRF